MPPDPLTEWSSKRIRATSVSFWPAHGIRAVCLRSTGIPETRTIEFVFGVQAKALGISREQFQELMESMSHTRRFTTLAELTNAAVLIASDLASGMTGTVANVTGGKIVD